MCERERERERERLGWGAAERMSVRERERERERERDGMWVGGGGGGAGETERGVGGDGECVAGERELHVLCLNANAQRFHVPCIHAWVLSRLPWLIEFCGLGIYKPAELFDAVSLDHFYGSFGNVHFQLRRFVVLKWYENVVCSSYQFDDSVLC